MTFFALSCFYFIVTSLGIIRLSKLESTSAVRSTDPNILQTLLIYVVVASGFRLLAWILCTAVFFNKDKKYIDEATYETILAATLKQSITDTLWLPVEPESINGFEESPVLLVAAIFTPEVFVVLSYLALTWLYFSTFIDSHDNAAFGTEKESRLSSSIRFRFIVVILVITQVTLITLTMAGLVDPVVILNELMVIEFLLPIIVIMLILYYQCKFSGVPQSRYTESKTRTLSICLIVWSVMRILQSWNCLYASRQFLGMTLLLSGYSYESYLFVPFILILQMMFLEIMPYLYVLDQNFISKMTDKATRDSSLVEPLFFENEQQRSRINITPDTSMLDPSS